MKEVKRQAKVGEKIKIVDAWLTGDEYKNGDILTASYFDRKGDLRVKEFDKPYISKMEYVVLEEEEFTLADLKPCYVLVERCGCVSIIAESQKGLSALQKNKQHSELSEMYQENMLENRGRKEYDIMEVYGFNKFSYLSLEISIEDRPLLYKRAEKTQAQIKLEELETKQRELADEIAKVREKL